MAEFGEYDEFDQQATLEFLNAKNNLSKLLFPDESILDTIDPHKKHAVELALKDSLYSALWQKDKYFVNPLIEVKSELRLLPEGTELHSLFAQARQQIDQMLYWSTCYYSNVHDEKNILQLFRDPEKAAAMHTDFSVSQILLGSFESE